MDIALDLRKTSPTFKDFLVVNNDLALTSDAYPAGMVPSASPNPILQDILQRLSMFLGEWFLDNSKGVPWFQQILVKKPNLDVVETLLMNTILSTIGVTSLTTFTVTPDFARRSCRIEFKCDTTSGPVDYSGTIQAAA